MQNQYRNCVLYAQNAYKMNGSVREPCERSLNERTFMSETFSEKHAKATELFNINREKHKRKSRRACRRDREPSRIPIRSLKSLRNKLQNRKVRICLYTYSFSEKHAISTELFNINREKHERKSHRVCRRDREPSRTPIRSLKSLRSKLQSRKVRICLRTYSFCIPKSSILSELPTALNVFDTDYQLEYSESYSGIVHQETPKEGFQYCTSL